MSSQCSNNYCFQTHVTFQQAAIKVAETPEVFRSVQGKHDPMTKSPCTNDIRRLLAGSKNHLKCLQYVLHQIENTLSYHMIPYLLHAHDPSN